MVLADASNGHAVLPAFILGLVMSRHYAEHRSEQQRLRVVAFAFLTPFFFIKGGLNVSLGAVFSNLGILAVLLLAKMIPKLGFIYPLARRADPPSRDLHHPADEHRPDLRNHLLPLRERHLREGAATRRYTTRTSPSVAKRRRLAPRGVRDGPDSTGTPS